MSFPPMKMPCELLPYLGRDYIPIVITIAKSIEMMNLDPRITHFIEGPVLESRLPNDYD